ncbi:DUF4349 domain-containing protein [Luteimonas sp. RD2P54]|uniref:DUF4349 domain-containing protein n=1 Tax=Luteimonas endophytica TaxID=3042023 RepID=A0ABT6JC67_9GAMM|nr:DUF4349 domain-containing protein [Luteimonas endophytica]MDH5824430.1 DUF4349 domain-containing protein [Luteimonas endophytica]
MTPAARVAALFAALLLPAALAGCGDGAPERRLSYAAPAAAKLDDAVRAAEDGDADAAAGSMLAYEHSAGVRLPAAAIAPRQRAVQDACRARKFGECVVLAMHQQGGDYPSASITVRIVPEGVEPMIALAGEGAELGERSTRAEDLAVVVRDNALARDRLQRELRRLEEFQQRPDLAVADMIALSERMAATQAQLEAAEREAAQHRRRIDTQLLSLDFRPPDGQAGRSEIGQALRDFGATLSMGTAWTIRALAFLIPLAALLVVVVLAVRRWRRRGARRMHQASGAHHG